VICFFDTSALAKLFMEEEGTTFVESLVSDNNNEIWVLDLSRIELLSCIFRRFRDKEIVEDELHEVINAIEEQFQEFNQEFLGPAVMFEAEQLMKKFGKYHGLRSLDALQLGGCLVVSHPDLYFLCSDARLCRIAEACEINVLNPLAQKKDTEKD